VRLQDFPDEGAPFSKDTILTDALYTTGAESLRVGPPPLDLATTEYFFRFYTSTNDGLLDPYITADSLKSQAERFFARFTPVTGNTVIEQDRLHIYDLITL
jgi:hypothetical protein